MAIITKGSVSKGVPATFTLNKADLAAHSLVSADPYFSVMANWEKVQLIYKSTVGGQPKSVVFDADGASPTAVFLASSTARDSFQISKLVIVDNDGGEFVIPRAQLVTADFDISFQPSQQTSWTYFGTPALIPFGASGVQWNSLETPVLNQFPSAYLPAIYGDFTITYTISRVDNNTQLMFGYSKAIPNSLTSYPKKSIYLGGNQILSNSYAPAEDWQDNFIYNFPTFSTMTLTITRVGSAITFQHDIPGTAAVGTSAKTGVIESYSGVVYPHVAISGGTAKVSSVLINSFQSPEYQLSSRYFGINIPQRDTSRGSSMILTEIQVMQNNTWKTLSEAGATISSNYFLPTGSLSNGSFITDPNNYGAATNNPAYIYLDFGTTTTIQGFRIGIGGFTGGGDEMDWVPLQIELQYVDQYSNIVTYKTLNFTRSDWTKDTAKELLFGSTKSIVYDLTNDPIVDNSIGKVVGNVINEAGTNIAKSTANAVQSGDFHYRWLSTSAKVPNFWAVGVSTNGTSGSIGGFTGVVRVGNDPSNFTIFVNESVVGTTPIITGAQVVEVMRVSGTLSIKYNGTTVHTSANSQNPIYPLARPYSSGGEITSSYVNYADLDANLKSSTLVISNNNLTLTGGAGSDYANFGYLRPYVDLAVNGKYYLEFTPTNLSGDNYFGIGFYNSTPWDFVETDFPFGDNSVLVYHNSTAILHVTNNSAGGVEALHPTWVLNQKVMVAIDFAANKVWFGVNGVWTGGNPATGSGGATAFTTPRGASTRAYLGFCLGTGASITKENAATYKPAGFTAI
jgi:hypothetical protein